MRVRVGHRREAKLTALRYPGFPLLLLVAVSQLANAQSRPTPTDTANRPVRDPTGNTLEYASPPIREPLMTMPTALSRAEAMPAGLALNAGSLLNPPGSSPSYAEVWRTASFGAGIGATGIWSADLDNDGATDLVLGGGNGFGGNAFWSIVAFNHTTREYEISWQSAPYTPAAITALRIVEEENTRRIWIGLSDGRMEVTDGSTRELVGTLTTGSEAISDFAVADADNDGATDVVVATSSRLLLYDPITLAVTREFPYGGSSVATGNVDTDSAVEVVLNTGLVLEIDGDDAVVQWGTSEFGAHIGLGDIDGDGIAELIAAETWFTIRAWDLDAQSAKWSIPTDKDIGSMRLIDVAGDSAPELVYGDGQWGSIHVVDAASRVELWSVPNPEHGVTDVAVVDADNDGAAELLWGAGWSSSGPDRLYVHDLETRSLEWQSADYSGGYHAVDIGDVDADGKVEIVVASFEGESGYANGQVMVFDAAMHALEWRSEIDAYGRHAGTGVHDLKLAKVDADAQLEIIIATDDGALYVIDGLTHEMQDDAFYGGGPPLMVLDTADLTGDGRPEVIAGTGVAHPGSHGAFVYVLDPVTGNVIWESARFAAPSSAIVDIEVADAGAPGMDLIAASSTIHVVRWSDKRHRTSASTGYLSVTAGDVGVPPGQEILGGRSDGSVHVLDGETLAVIATYDVCAEPVTALEMLPSSRILASCGNSLTVYDFDAVTVVAVAESGAASIGANGALVTGVVNGRAVVVTGGTEAVKFTDISNNQVPVLTPSSATVHWRDVLDLQLSAKDGDGDALMFELVSLPHLGTAVWLDRELGKLRYTARRVGTGLDSMVVRVTDGFQYSSPQMLEIVLENTAPQTATPLLEFHWRGRQTASVVARDPDADPLSFTLTTGPGHGVAQVDAATGAITYTPTGTYIGTDSLSYTVTDGADAVTEVVQIMLTNTSSAAPGSHYETASGATIDSPIPAQEANAGTLAYTAAGSYAEAEAGGFVIDTSNPLGAKVAAAFLPISNTAWHDVVNDQAGTLIGNPTIGQDATGRYVQFDGVDDIIDMGRSYSHGPDPPMDGLAGVGNGTHSMVGLYDWDSASTGGNICAERDGTSSEGSVFQHHTDGDTASIRGGTTNRLYASGITSGIRVVGYSRHGTDARVDGYIDGVPQNLGGTLSNSGSDVEVNLAFGGYWDGYPVSSDVARYRGKLYLMLMFNEALDDDEQAPLGTNPWQIFRAPATDMTITADAIESPVKLGDDATVVFNVSNLGTVDAPGVVTEVELPEAVAFVSIESSAGTCSSGADNLRCEIGTVPAGSTRTVTVIATAMDTGEAAFNARVLADADDNAANDSVAVSLTIVEAVDLVVNTLPATQVGLDQSANIRAVMDNRSTLNATAVELVISLGQGLRADSASWSLGSCTLVPQQIECVSDSFAAQGSATVDFNVTGTATGVHSYTVSVSSAEEDIDPTDNSRNGTVTVNAVVADGGGSIGLLFLCLMSFATLLARSHHVVKMATMPCRRSECS